MYSFNPKYKQWVSAPPIQPLLMAKELKMEAFMVNRWHNRWDEGIKQNLQWIKEVIRYFKDCDINFFM
jgi:prostaglandin reductase 1